MDSELTKNIIIIDSNIPEREKLSDALLECNFKTNIIQAESILTAQELIEKKEFDICFIGIGIRESLKFNLLEAISKSSKNKFCIFIPIVKKINKEKVFQYIDYGAHGVLLSPVKVAPLKRVIETALLKTAPSKPKNKNEEAITFLLTLSNTLQEVAEELKTQKSQLSTNKSKIKKSLITALLKDETDIKPFLLP